MSTFLNLKRNKSRMPHYMGLKHGPISEAKHFVALDCTTVYIPMGETVAVNDAKAITKPASKTKDSAVDLGPITMSHVAIEADCTITIHKEVKALVEINPILRRIGMVSHQDIVHAQDGTVTPTVYLVPFPSKAASYQDILNGLEWLVRISLLEI